MEREHRAEESEGLFRRWITWTAVVGTAAWTGYFFTFLVYQSLFGEASPDNWFLLMVQQHPAATIGISAFCLVAVLEVSRGSIEFEVVGFKFRGASGPVILWVMCFLAMVFALWSLWDKGVATIP